MGPIKTWSPVLIHSLNFILNSRQPCFLFWGKEAFCFYNDGYIPILGQDKHPNALGGAAADVWKEIWTVDTNPQYLAAMDGQATWNEDRMVPIARNGRVDEAYFTYGYSPIYLDDGTVNGVMVTALETTRKVIEKRNLNESVEQLSRVLQVMKIGFYDWDILNNKVEMNQQMQGDWGLASGLEFSEVFEAIHPNDRERVNKAIQEAISKPGTFHCTYRVLRGQEVLYIDARGLVSFEDGKAVRFFGTSLDVTEKQLISEELALEKHKLEAIFQDTPAAQALWRGDDLIFEKANPSYKAIFPGKILQGPLISAVPELKGQGFDDLLRQVLHTGENYIGKEIPAMIPNAEGKLEQKFYDFSYVQIRDQNASPYGVYAHAIDVTERVRSSRESENLLSDLQEEKGIREKFVMSITHDLRTPITASKMSAQLLQRINDPIKERELLNRIVDNMNRADNMIQDILDVNRMKAGEEIYLEKQSLELRTLIHQVLEEFASINGDRYRFNSNQMVEGVWDRDALKRILENLLSNAYKYGDQSLPIILKLEQKGTDAFVSIKNFGNPIDPIQQQKIFQPYHRTVNAAMSHHKGWGIGLSLVKALTQAHHGDITLESTHDKGTTFTLKLPINVQGNHRSM